MEDTARERRLLKARAYKEKVAVAKSAAEKLLEEAQRQAQSVISEAEAKRKDVELEQENLAKEKALLRKREQAFFAREQLCSQAMPLRTPSCDSPVLDSVNVGDPERARILARIRQRRYYARKVAAKVQARNYLSACSDSRGESTGEEVVPNRCNKTVNRIAQSLTESFIKATANYNNSARRLVLSRFWRSDYLRDFLPLTLESSKVEQAQNSIIKSVRDTLQTVKWAKRRDHLMHKQNVLIGVSGSRVVKNRLQSAIARILGMKKGNFYRASKRRALLDSDQTGKYPTGVRAARSDRMCEELVNLIQDWWHNNTRVSPNKKDVAQKRLGVLNYVVHPMHWLEETEVEFFLRFQEMMRREHPEYSIGLRSFQSKKPFYIRTLKDRNVCCCKQHVEMDMLRQGLHTARQKMHGQGCNCDCSTCIHTPIELDATSSGVRRCSLNDDPLLSVRLMAESILCPKVGGALWHKKQCIMGTCANCGIRLLRLCKQEVDRESNQNTVKWESFQYMSLDGTKRKRPPPDTGTGVKSKPAVRLRLVMNETPVHELIDELKLKLPAFLKHNFRQRWQSEQFQECFKTFPVGTVLSVIDFAENYTFKFQNEIMAQHWDNKMCTILVHITYRHGPESVAAESSREIITEYHFYMSDDNNHDTLFVQHCLEKHWNWMCEQKIAINQHIVWSDGCAAQFKSCRPFYYVARYGNWHNGVKMCWNFFGSGHGKGVHDGAGGTVKSALAREQLKVVGGAKLQDAADAVKFLETRFALEKELGYDRLQGIRRHFWLIKLNEVNRKKKWDCSQVKGTRSLHCFYGFNPESTTQIYTRELSCFCSECQEGRSLSCPNLRWAGQFKLQFIDPKSPADVAEELRRMGDGFNRAEDGRAYDHGSLSELVRVGDLFAVEATKPNPWDADFYLHVCTQPLHQYCGKTLEDECGILFHDGDWVLKCLWYQQTLGSSVSFSLNSSQKAGYVHADLVRHIRFGVKPTLNPGYYTLSANSLAEIMDSLKNCW